MALSYKIFSKNANLAAIRDSHSLIQLNKRVIFSVNFRFPTYNTGMPQTEVRKLLADYLSYLEIEKNRSPKTRENYEHYLNVFLDFAKIKTPGEITDTTCGNSG